MANFIIVVDPDMGRREGFVEAIKNRVAPVDGLITDACATGDFCAIWAADAQAPISHVADDEGAAIIWGDAISEDSPERIDALQLRSRWNDLAHRSKAVFDGFYAGVVYHPDSGLIAGADLLGLFPLYYYANEDVLLMGSSPELFRYHSVFRMEFNPAGLVGILLTMHIFDGQTLLRGVRRLAPGHLLVWGPRAGSEEVLLYRYPVSKRYFSFPFSAHVDILDQVIDAAIVRHVPNDRTYSLLLSGGIDSRMLAGYFKEKGVDVVGLTLGEPTDSDMECALKVARKLGLQHHTAEVSLDQYPFYAHLQAKWEHGANGFNTIHSWGIHQHLRGIAPRVLSGYLLDCFLDINLTWAHSPSSTAMSFEPLFAFLNGYGLRLDILRKLLRREVFGDAVDEVISRMRTVYEGYSEVESQRVWCFELHHRFRFWIGSILWRLSFGAWPVLPQSDRKVLEVAGAMPASTLAERRVQKELLCKRFPQLAALPLDQCTNNPRPLRPRLRHQLGWYFYGLLNSLRGGVARSSMIERRRYCRLYDFDGPGWLAVRREAEPYRENVFHLFHKDVLKEVLPGPDVPLCFKNGIIEPSGLKSLLGFLLWSKDHL